MKKIVVQKIKSNHLEKHNSTSHMIQGIIEGTVHPKIEMWWKYTPPQAIQHVDEFVYLLEKIWRNFALFK